MEVPPRVRGAVRRLSRMSLLPRLLFVCGGALFLAALWPVALALSGEGSVYVAVLDFVFVGAPGIALAYTGVWLPASDIRRERYPRLVGWVLGGVLLMYGFILLRALHPGVTAEWSLGTQAIGLTIGSVGGLAIGVQETRARMRTEQLEARTRELTAREAELERQNEQLEEFASVLSHDLRNPLSVARGHLELARAESDDEHLETVADAHERMAALIDDLLTLARQGNAISDVEPVDIGGLAEACWGNVATAGATLSVEDDETIRADRERLRQLIENLFRNGVEHGGENVTITVGTLADGFYVADDGPGIPDGDRESVFESGYSTAQKGTGFGLAIVEQVAEAHGWTVEAVDGEDGGARFEITGVEFE